MKETRNYLGITPLLGEFRNHLRITATDLDAQLMSALKAAVNSAEHEISQVIAISAFKREDAFNRTLLLGRPLLEVSSVKVDGAAVPDTSYLFKDNGVLEFGGSVEGSRVEVEYKAGYEVIPEDIKYAVFLLGGSNFNNPTDRPEERDRTSARNLLRPYRSWGMR